MCAVSCLIVSRPSGFFDVKILIEQSFSIKKSKSFKSPSTLITIACFASDLLIFSATSRPVTLSGNDKLFPSGNVIIGI